MATSTNANSVPMLTSSASSVSGTKVEISATTTPVRIVVRNGVPNRGTDLGEGRRQQPVAAHREEDPALTEHQDHHHGGQPDQRPDRDHGGEAWVTHRPERLGERCVDLDVGVLDHAGHDQRDRDVQDGADRERGEDADGHVALRVLGLLRRGRDDVEADVGEEHQGRAGEDPADAERAGRQPEVLQQRRGGCPAAAPAEPDGGMNGE